MEVESYSTVNIQVEQKTTSAQVVIYPSYPIVSNDYTSCLIKLIPKGTGYVNVTTYQPKSSLAYTNIIIIDAPFDI